MKFFLRKIALFFIIPLCILCVWLPLIYFVNNKEYNNYEVGKNVTSLFVGDSHVQHAIDDKLFPNSINLCQTAESLLFTLYKIKAILHSNPSVKKVYLGFSYHSVSAYFDDVGNHSADISSKYFIVLPNEEKKQVLIKSEKEFPRFMMNVIINGTRTLYTSKENYSFMGFYASSYNYIPVTQKSMDKRLTELFYENGQPRGFSPANISYLAKIIDLCKSENVQLILLNTPLHPYFKGKVPLKFIEEYNTVINQYHLKVVDFNNLILSDSCFMPDGDHVSKQGSILTTNYLKGLN